MSRSVLNFVNFIRGCEPRRPKDLLLPVREELAADRKAGIKHTFLFQYDALLREDLVSAVRDGADENTELGLWLEIVRPLTERVGIRWRGRPGYDWDWYVNPGFPEAYTQEERRRLIDEAFRRFRETFGYYPSVAGSWLLDAYSMQYMSETYRMDAFCICREQLAVDAYTLWGGYYSGGYYPSKNNMLCPSQRAETRIGTPVFRMLGIDPIYGYDETKNSENHPRLNGCYTMEPFWDSGKSRDVMEWYFREYYENPSLSGSYATTGQENSFGWEGIADGYRLQLELAKKWESEGKLTIETLGETGRRFRETYRDTPPAALSALTDWSGNGIQSVWFSSRFWRGNLFLRDGTLFFRDLFVFDDRYRERYLETPCTAWSATYDNLPVVDRRRCITPEQNCAWSFTGTATGMTLTQNEAGDTLTVTVTDSTGERWFLTMDETGFSAEGSQSLVAEFGSGGQLVSVGKTELRFCHEGFPYAVSVPQGQIATAGASVILRPEGGKLTVRLRQQDPNP